MKIESIEDLLIFEEGEKLSAYQDTLGYWTIGVGHLIDPRRGGVITPAISRIILDDDISDHEDYLRTYAWYQTLSIVRKAVLISMVHQLGSIEAWPHFIDALECGDYNLAAQEMLDSVVAKQQATARWDRASLMMRTDQWPVILQST